MSLIDQIIQVTSEFPAKLHKELISLILADAFGIEA